MVQLQTLTVGETTQPLARLPYFRNRLCMEVDGSGRIFGEVKAEWKVTSCAWKAPETLNGSWETPKSWFGGWFRWVSGFQLGDFRFNMWIFSGVIFSGELRKLQGRGVYLGIAQLTDFFIANVFVVICSPQSLWVSHSWGFLYWSTS